VLALQGICKSFKRPDQRTLEILSGVDLTVGPGTTIGILGRSGSGKSTLLSIIGLLDIADAGTYELDGSEVGNLSGNKAARVRGERIGFVFQRSFLLPHLSASENVEVPLLHATSVPRASVRRHLVMEALDQVGIGHRARHRPRELSGGEQQLVALARALVRRPAYVLADEPTGNLDSATGERIVASLATLARDGSVSVVMVTHDRELAAILDRRLQLTGGKLQEIA
jgi:putative ABC transport system ATP-binding protein